MFTQSTTWHSYRAMEDVSLYPRSIYQPGIGRNSLHDRRGGLLHIGPPKKL